MAMRVYRAPNSGMCFQYEEGKQPDGYVPVRPAAAKKRTTANKAAKPANK